MSYQITFRACGRNRPSRFSVTPNPLWTENLGWGLSQDVFHAWHGNEEPILLRRSWFGFDFLRWDFTRTACLILRGYDKKGYSS